jgi:hypothetical protein
VRRAVVALRKETMKKQVNEAIAKDTPSERPVVTIYAVAGPSPILLGLLAPLCLITAIWALLVKHYFITITEESVLIRRVNKYAGRPRKLVLTVPRGEVAALVRDGERGSLWSYFHFQFPDKPEPTRFNVGRQWRSELDQFMPVITAPTAP